MNANQPPIVLTVAGSDSGGAAGLQADLKTLTALGVYGMSVVTVVTAQNSVNVTALHPLPPRFVAQQLEAVLEDYGAAAVKTGFVGSAEAVGAIAEQLVQYRTDHNLPLVVDPVLVNHRGHSMFPPAVTEAYRRHLLPHCDVVTPNCPEAALLTGQAVTIPEEMVRAARHLHALGAGTVLVKGSRQRQEMVDVFYDGREAILLRSRHLDTENTHGSGDTLSAAVAAFLARGLSPLRAIEGARSFTATAIREAAGWQLGAGHGPVNHFVKGPWAGESRA